MVSSSITSNSSIPVGGAAATVVASPSTMIPETQNERKKLHNISLKYVPAKDRQPAAALCKLKVPTKVPVARTNSGTRKEQQPRVLLPKSLIFPEEETVVEIKNIAEIENKDCNKKKSHSRTRRQNSKDKEETKQKGELHPMSSSNMMTTLLEMRVCTALMDCTGDHRGDDDDDATEDSFSDANTSGVVETKKSAAEIAGAITERIVGWWTDEGGFLSAKMMGCGPKLEEQKEKEDYVVLVRGNSRGEKRDKLEDDTFSMLTESTATTHSNSTTNYA